MTNQSQTQPSTEDVIYVRQAIPFSTMSEVQQKFLREVQAAHNRNPNHVDVTIAMEQLDFIKKCIAEATKHNAELAAIKDVWDDNMSEVLVELIDATVSEPGEYGAVHSWVI